MRPTTSERPGQQLLARYPTVPWRKVAGLRDLLIHDYEGVDPTILWEITQQDLQPLKFTTQRMIEDFDKAP